MLVALRVMFKLALTSRPFPKQSKTKCFLGQLCAWSESNSHVQKASQGREVTQ